MKNLILFALALCLASCATNSGNTRKDTAGRVTNSALSILGRAVTRVALATIDGAANDFIAGKKINLTHSAAQGVYANADNLVTAEDVTDLINAYSAGAIPAVAIVAGDQFNEANPQTSAEKVKVVNKIAEAISAAAVQSTK